MPQTFYIIPTAAGEAKIARAQGLGVPIKFTQMAVGDGGGALPEPSRTAFPWSTRNVWPR